MSKHTEGPWQASYSKFSEVRAANGALIAECKKLNGLVVLQANARLIAKAPELKDMAACLQAVCARLISEYGPEEVQKRLGVDVVALASRVNAVLTEAEGGAA